MNHSDCTFYDLFSRCDRRRCLLPLQHCRCDFLRICQMSDPHFKDLYAGIKSLLLV